MKVNSNVQFNEDDAHLSLEEELIKPSADLDDADLSSVEIPQAPTTVEGTQVVSSISRSGSAKKIYRTSYNVIAMFITVVVVVGLYVLAVFYLA